MLMIGMIAAFLAAALLLFVTSPDKRSAAIKQGFLLGILGIVLMRCVRCPGNDVRNSER